MATAYSSKDRPDAVNAYIEEIIAAGKRYGFSLAHEDGQGAFIVEPRDADEHNDRWLRDAGWVV